MFVGMKENSLEVEYSEEQIQSVLQDIGLDVISETENVFMTYCPFHRNTDSPSFAVNKITGLYICFSPICDVRGNLIKLVSTITNKNIFAARRLIAKNERTTRPLSEIVEELLEKNKDIPAFDQTLLDRMHIDFWESDALEYMHSRKFEDKTLEYFQIGYSHKKQLMTVPVHDWKGKPVGIVGRTIVGKRFQNSSDLPTSKILFNAHRARKSSETVIIVESSMDAMRIHQAGFPFVVATLGGFFTQAHQQIIDKYFHHVIIMTDYDNPDEHRSLKCNKCENTCLGHNAGRALGEKIISALPNKRIKWASYDYGIIYPHGAKDAGDMTDIEIKKCILNAVTASEYEFWKKDFPELSRI